MRAKAERWLAEILGAGATFRQGQWEAIEVLVQKRQRTLVVQRTGWGKSLVYFLATRLLREQDAGVTILISPLLSLMRNQMSAAKSWGIYAETINSDNQDHWERIETDLLAGRIDLLLISPERLANDRFQKRVWSRLRHQVGLLVVDEAHCISDWGHDFRPNYRRIMRILDEIPSSTPILGTTATANDRVIHDVGEILGAGLNILRGPLTRESPRLYAYPEPQDAATRLTLLAYLMKRIPGNGIIYCTTTRDCQQVADWLQLQGFAVKPYYANVEKEMGESRVDLENQLLQNEVKALVSSVALGMGFDKPDLHFVIHYQLPGNIISYYQQIGRAGRAIENAHIILMHGQGDEDIQEFFIETAFPKPEHVQQAILALEEQGALTRSALQQFVNVRLSVLEKILTHLEIEKVIERRDRKYHLVNPDTALDYHRWNQVTQQRYAELNQMKAYVTHEDCFMRFIAEALDDPTSVQRCGHCKNCTGQQSKFDPDLSEIQAASQFLHHGKPILIEPRKRFPMDLPGVRKTTDLLVNSTGLALSNYYESGWGDKVRDGRNHLNHYSDELVEASVAALQSYWQTLDSPPKWVAAVPSLRRPLLVPDFARRLAHMLGLPYQGVVQHLQQHPVQQTMLNSFQQARNIQNAFDVDGQLLQAPLLLVDDIADSRWTLTIIGHLLQQKGVSKVYPFVLATTG